MNFEEIDTEPSTGKNDGFWLLWVTFKEHIKQNTIMALLKKTNSHLVDICRLIKEINNIPRGRSKEKTWFKFLFFQRCLVLMKF